MATSLAKQLQQLSTKSTSELVDVSKGRVSFLFSKEDAAAIDRDSVFHLARNGLNELVELDEIFASYTDNLFSIDGKHLERTVVSSDVNDDLNSLIENFCLLLAPYVQRSCSLKTLEWLIQRFHIEKFNENSLIFMFLPFHELKLFARVAQVINPKDVTHKWHWLQEIQLEDRTVTKKQLHRFFSKQLDVLTELCTFVLQLNQVHSERTCQYYNSFFFASLIGCFECKKAVNETVLSTLMSIIRKCMSSRSEQLQSVALGLMAIILQKSQLESEVLRKMLNFMVKRVNNGLIDSFLLLVFTTCIKQQEFELTDESVAKIFQLPLTQDIMESVFSRLSPVSCQSYIMQIIQCAVSSDQVLQMDSFQLFVKMFLSKLDAEGSGEETHGAKVAIADILCSTSSFSNPYCIELVKFIACEHSISFKLALDSLRETKPKLINKIIKKLDSLTLSDQNSYLIKLTTGNYETKMLVIKKLEQLESIEVNESLKQCLLQCLGEESSPLLTCKAIDFILGRELISQLPNDDLVTIIFDRMLNAFLDDKSNSSADENSDLMTHIGKLFNAVQLQKAHINPKIFVMKHVISIVDQKDPSMPAKVENLMPNEVAEVFDLLVNLSKLQNWRQFHLLVVILVKNGYVKDVNMFEKICQLIAQVSNEEDEEKKRLPKRLKKLISSNDDGLYSSMLEYALCVPFTYRFSKHMFDISSLDFVLDENSIQVYCAVQLMCGIPSRIPFMIKSVGFTNFIHLLLGISLFPVEFFDSLSSRRACQISIWSVMKHLCVKNEFPKQQELLFWPVLCSLNTKKTQVRACVLEFCEVFHNVAASHAIMSFILEYKEEIKADRNYIKKLLIDFCEKMPAIVEDMMSMIRNYKSDFLLAKALPLLIGLKNNSISNLLSITLNQQCIKVGTNNINLCKEILQHISCENVTLFIQPLLKCLALPVSFELIQCAVSAVTTQSFQQLEFENQVHVFNRLIHLRKFSAEIDVLKSTLQRLPLSAKLLHRCLGLPDYESNAKPRRSRVDSFTTSNMNLEKIQLLLDFVTDREFSEEDAYEILITLNALIVHLDRSHIMDKNKNEYENMIVLTVGVLKDFITRYNKPHDDILDTEIVLSLIKRFNDVNIRGQCFELLVTHYEQWTRFLCDETEISQRAMTIFSALCDSLGSQQDQFSFRLILTSVQRLLVPLLNSTQGKTASLNLFLTHFINALKSHPCERQIMLINTCISHKSFDRDNYFWQLVVGLFLNTTKGAHVQNAVMVVSQVCEKETLWTNLLLISNLLKFTKALLDSKLKSAEKFYKLGVLVGLPEKRIRFAVMEMLLLIPTVINSTQFVEKLIHSRLQRETQYNEMFRNILSQLFVLQESKRKLVRNGEEMVEQVNESAAITSPDRVKQEFAKTVEFKLNEALKAVDILFDDSLFFQVFTELLDNLTVVQVKRSLEILNIRISRPGSNFLKDLKNDQIKSLYDLILVHMCHEDIRICQFVLITLIKLLKVQPLKVEYIFGKMEVLIARTEECPSLRIQLCSLIGELIKSVKQGVVPHLPKVISFVLKVQVLTSNEDKLMFESVLFCIESLFEHLFEFLTPYLMDVICFMLELVDYEQKFKLKKSFTFIYEKLSTFEMRVFIPILISVCDTLFKKCRTSTLFLNKVKTICMLFTMHLDQNSSREDFEANALKVTNLLIKFLDLRHQLVKHCSNTQKVTHVATVENGDLATTPSGKRKPREDSKVKASKISKQCFRLSDNMKIFLESEEFISMEVKSFEPLISFVLKNSESAVRQLLMKIFTWTTSEEDACRRQVTFYHLLNVLSQRLKGLMLLFLPNYLKSMKEFLSCEDVNDNVKFSYDEIYFTNTNILTCLCNVMSHDINGSFTSPERVSELIVVMTKQWKVFVNHDQFDDYVINTVCPCISQMMLACQDDDARNVLHSHVLSYARDSSTKVRISVLRAISAIANRIMEEYSMFYPEAVPLLAELKEDNCLDVENECDATLRTIEKVVGEAVHEHFPKIE